MSIVALLSLGIQIGYASLQQPEVKVERIIVTGCWVDLGSLQPGTSGEVLPCPTILVSLEDGVKYPNAAIGQGDLRDDPKRDHSFQSMGTLSIKGKKYPFDMGVEYEFLDNAFRHFKIKQGILVGDRKGRSVLRSPDGNRLLILFWEPHPREKKG